MTDELKLRDFAMSSTLDIKEMLKAWMQQKEFSKSMQMKLRKQLIDDFSRTELVTKLHSEKQKSVFRSRDYVIDTLQAESLYCQNNHFTLSVFFTESRHTQLLPDFEKESFRFDDKEIVELIELLGLKKSDKISRRVLNRYKSSGESLLNVLLIELLSAQCSVETRNVTTQTEEQPTLLDLSLISTKSKGSRRRKHHGLAKKDFVMRKPKKLKEVSLIAQNLEKMSANISIISGKLDDFKSNPTQDDSRSIIGYVGTIMSQLNGCIGNFETICREIKEINDSRNRNYSEWMDDLRNSENGRRFLKKLQKSFGKVMSEEKSKLKKEYRKKFERERSKLSKLSRSTAIRPVGKKPEGGYPDKVVKEISELYENTCQMIKTVEKESELFEKSLEVDHQKKIAAMSRKPSKSTPKQISQLSLTTKRITSPKENATLQIAPRSVEDAASLKVSPTRTKIAETKLKFPPSKINLNECQRIHSESSPDPSYSSKSFELDKSEDDDNN